MNLNKMLKLAERLNAIVAEMEIRKAKLLAEKK